MVAAAPGGTRAGLGPPRRTIGGKTVPCYEPIKAYKGPDGIKFNSKDGYGDMPLKLNCGQCLGCRMDRKRSWAIRCMHEAQMHENNCFVTLTYDNEHLPEDQSLDVTHWQKFAKRLRKAHGSFRFMHAGEYGEKTLRPHYHALLFGLDFRDTVELSSGPNQHKLRVSASLSKIWTAGFHAIGDITFDSAAYVASYCVKKTTGKKAAQEYARLDPETGEYWEVKPEYGTMSRRPGLGSAWIDKYQDDVYPDNFVVINGQKWKPPNYYDKRLAKKNPLLHSKMLEQRQKQVKENKWNYTEERLQTRKELMWAKIKRSQELKDGYL